MRELVVISGKGGTGKTSVAASFALLAERPVVADADVDAADLHLVLVPDVTERHEFRSGHEAVIVAEACTGCGACLALCRFGAVIAGAVVGRPPRFAIDPLACEGCGVCVRFCPEQAILFPERRCGEWMISRARCGPLVHARLDPGAENSGKLVATVRQQARRLALAGGHPWLLVDGPPGIGCPVIASITGASAVVVVTEPTVAGEHDLARVLSLARQLGVPAAICLNKWDLSPAISERLEAGARTAGAFLAGRIRYDRAVTLAQVQGLAVVETDAESAADIRAVWQRLDAWTPRANDHPQPPTIRQRTTP